MLVNSIRFCLLLAVLPTGVAVAQDSFRPIEQRLSAEQLDEVGLSAQQLSLLNRYLQQADAATAAGLASTPAATAALPSRSSTSPAPATASPDATHLIGLDAERIDTRIRGAVAGWAPGDEFSLENGQRWQVLKGNMKLRKPLESPAVVLVPGIAGRWFLQFDEDMPKARVFRVD